MARLLEIAPERSKSNVYAFSFPSRLETLPYQALSLKERLSLQGHVNLCQHVDDHRELFAAAENLARRNLGYGFRHDCPYPEEVFRVAVLRYVPRLPPIMLKDENNEPVMGPAGKALTAIHLALKKMGIEASILFVNQEVVKGGKSWAKSRTDKNGALPVEEGQKFDSDCILVFSPDTPPEKMDLAKITKHAQKYLKSEKIKMRVKSSPWRETATWIEFGFGEPQTENWQSLGQVYCLRNSGHYPGKSFVEHVWEAPPNHRYVYLSWPNDQDDEISFNLDDYEEIAGVEIDLLWQHRAYRRIHFYQGKTPRSLKPLVAHAPDLGTKNILEAFYWACRFRDRTSTNTAFFSDQSLAYPAHWEYLFAFPNKGYNPQEIRARAYQSACWEKRHILFPARARIGQLVREEESQGKNEAVRSLTNFLLENIEGALDPDPFLGIYYLLSPDDNQNPNIPIFGSGLLELFFPQCYRLVKENQAELLEKAQSWKWGLNRDGGHQFYQFLLEKLNHNPVELRKILTPCFAQNSLRAKLTVVRRIHQALKLS